jgi:hypothetical protein
MLMKRLIIREALPTDYDDIVCFYQENPDQHVMLRDEQAVRGAIGNGTFFLAIDTEATNSGRICGAGAVYDVIATLGTGGSVILKEAGGSNVKEAYRGFGIHKIFHAARALHEYILDRGGFEHYFGAIVMPNDPSVKNIRKFGFQPWPDPPLSLVIERLPYAQSEEGIAYFRLFEEQLHTHADYLLKLDALGHISRKHPETGALEQVELILSIETIKRYKPILEAIRNGTFKE